MRMLQKEQNQNAPSSIIDPLQIPQFIVCLLAVHAGYRADSDTGNYHKGKRPYHYYPKNRFACPHCLPPSLV